MNLTQNELEYRIIYSIIVAGKSAKFAENVVNKLFPKGASPLVWIRNWILNNCLEEVLRYYKTGNYKKMEKCFTQLVNSNVDLATCGPEELEAIHGIGPKTARFFILWTRKDANYAALDVHILRWLKAKGYDAPKATPTGKKHRELEIAFLEEAKKLNMSPRDLDAKIWAEGSKSKNWSPNNTIGESDA